MNKQNNLHRHHLTPSPLTGQVFDLVKNAILANNYSPNQRLNEVELSSSLGVSRGPIREALQKLSYEGLVRLVPNKGAFVINFTLKEVEDIFELREYLEVMAVRLAAQRADQSDYRKLSELLKATEQIIEKNRNASYPWDSDFHVKIAQCTYNQELAEYINRLNAQTHLIRYRSGSRPGRAAGAFKEHVEIYRSLCEKNCEKSEHLMMQHIRTAKNNIMNFISDEESLSKMTA
jgi:DNA-binding GntR family transcriptional regulator